MIRNFISRFFPKSVVDEKVAFSQIESCVKEIRSWMDLNKLKLNVGNTEFLLLGRKAQLNKVFCGSMTVGSATISTSGLVSKEFRCVIPQ